MDASRGGGTLPPGRGRRLGPKPTLRTPQRIEERSGLGEVILSACGSLFERLQWANQQQHHSCLYIHLVVVKVMMPSRHSA